MGFGVKNRILYSKRKEDLVRCKVYIFGDGVTNEINYSVALALKGGIWVGVGGFGKVGIGMKGGI